MRKREAYGQSARDRKVQGIFRQCYVSGGEKTGKANGVRWQSALNDPEFILQGKGTIRGLRLVFCLKNDNFSSNI